MIFFTKYPHLKYFFFFLGGGGGGGGGRGDRVILFTKDPNLKKNWGGGVEGGRWRGKAGLV